MRELLDSVLAVDFAGAGDLGNAVHRAMTAFAAQKPRTLDVSLALKDALPELQDVRRSASSAALHSCPGGDVQDP